MKQNDPKDVIRMFYFCETEPFSSNLNVIF